jgi:hypothetical protein
MLNSQVEVDEMKCCLKAEHRYLKIVLGIEGAGRVSEASGTNEVSPTAYQASVH